MRKLFTVLTTCLLASTAWAVDIVFDATVDVGTGGSTAGEFVIEKDGITIQVEQGVANGTHYRFYKNKTVTVTSAFGNITSIVFTCVGANDAQWGPAGFTCEGYSYEDILGTWTGGAEQVVFTASVAQVRATKIVVTVGGEVGLLPPSITPASGTYFADVEVSMKCSTSGAKIYYTTNGSDPTTSSTQYTAPFTVPFSLGQQVTVKAISEKDGEVSALKSATYTFEETPQFGWADMFNTADNANVTFTYPSIVLWQSGINMYVKDDTGYGLVYQSTGQTYQIGDIIPAYFGGTKTTYNNHPELQSPKGFQAATEFVEVAPDEITPNQVDDAHWAHYVLLKNVTVAAEGNGGTFTDANGNSCTFFNNTFNVAPPADGVHDVYGIVAAYREMFQILPISYDEPPKREGPKDVASIEELYELLQGKYGHFTTPLTAIYQNGLNLYVKDYLGTYSLVSGQLNETFENGDYIMDAEASWTLYQNNKQLLPVPATFVKAGHSSPVEPEVMPIEEVMTDMVHWYLGFEDVNIVLPTGEETNIMMVDETGQMILFDKFNVMEKGAAYYGTYYVEGFLTVFRNELEFYPTLIKSTVDESYDFIVDGIAYKIIDNNRVKVTYHAYSSNDNYKGMSQIHIPEDVAYNGDIYHVSEIGDYAFAGCTSLSSMIIPTCISSIASNAFSITSLEYLYIVGNGDWQGGAIPVGVNALYIGSGVTSIRGLQVNPSAIYSFAAVPPECDENTFLGYNAVLHVPATSFTDYFMADYWCYFADIRNDAVAPVSVSISDNEAEIMIGNMMTLTATVSPNNATPNTVVWTTTNPQVAVVNNGMVTTIGEGECDIVASCLDKQVVCHVTVFDPISVTLDQTEVTIERTQQVTLIATVTPEGANIQNIIWTTSDASVATVNNGVVTGIGLGECNIIASYLGKQAVCHVTVIEAIIHISLDKHEVRVLPNHMITITPTMSPSETTLKVTSSDPDVAVARLINGVVQVAGRAEGTTMVIVGSVDDTAIPDTCVVTVYTEIGDVNSDGYVNISDVTDLIDYLLSGNGDSVSQTNADCDKDGNVNIADVTTLIDYLLGGIWPGEHIWVDLGLPSGTLWAACNVGATSPEEYGDYFAWGETEPKDYYDSNTYKWYSIDNNYSGYTKYCTNSGYGYNGFVDNKMELDSEDDAATVNWGEKWRMPSCDQFEELSHYCSWQWTQRNGVNGHLVTGPSGNAIFLPAAGHRFQGSLSGDGSKGSFWSRTLDSEPLYMYVACGLGFDSGDRNWIGGLRSNGYTVRAVRVPQN